ncbi:hypothetical protein [Salipiger bermudensis]|uniref:hypothetical protein n=1 Tax=Salipiger bermudensis TaxID=344736 RepID=UPI001CD7459A|nr:hypothetical protein [Salipiger bermudensis]MCA0962335.1 hypothetical protein [Salipiger bermudensis]
MSRLTTLTLTSHRGRDYPVELFTPDTGFTETGAVYLFLKLPEGRSRQVQVFYVGQTCALGTQLLQDRRPGGPWDRAEALGFDAIGGLALARPEDRALIAAEFIHSWHPPCNDGSGALAGLAGLAAPAPFRTKRAMAGR